MSVTKSPPPLIFLLSTFLLLQHLAAVSSIGVNYGTVADNLPTPVQVAQFIKGRTIIDRVKIFDSNPDMIRAFAGTGILLSITVPNGDIPSLADPRNARRWVDANIKPFYPQTQIHYVLMGSEVLQWNSGNQSIVSNLTPAMTVLQNVLTRAGLGAIKVTTAHSLGILLSSNPPSAARFRPGWDKDFLAPLLLFHRQSKTPFMVNPYPYFSWTPQTQSFDLFEANPGVHDPFTNKTYTNVYDLLLDAVFSSMKRLGFGDVEIAVGEVGWPSAGNPDMYWCTVENARWHNLNVLRKADAGVGTPLMPGRKFETYIFALFNEDLKPGNADERNFGMFRPDFSPVYDIGIMKPGQLGGGGGGGNQTSPPTTAPGAGNQWCVPTVGASDPELEANIKWVCSSTGIDCSPIQQGGACFNPNTVRSHAAYVMNAYYQANGHQNFNCYFSDTGIVTVSDPSYGTCTFVA